MSLGCKSELYSGNGPSPDSFGSISIQDLSVTASLRDASFFISVSDCHCLYSFGRNGAQIQNRMREALEISYVYRDLARAVIDAKENCKKKEHHLNEGNSQYEYQKRTSVKMEIQHIWN